MTYEVGLSAAVRAFHVMPGMPGPEGQRHHHDYRIELVVRQTDPTLVPRLVAAGFQPSAEGYSRRIDGHF